MIEEQAVLGSILIDNNCIHNITPILQPHDFLTRTYGEIYSTMLDLTEQNKPIDSTMLVTRGFELPTLLDLTDSVATSANAEHYAQVVKEKSQKRQLKGIATELQGLTEHGGMSAEECVMEAERRILSIRQHDTGGGAQSIGEIARELEEIVKARIESGEGFFGHSTGFAALDELTGGMQNGETFVVAGRPSMGKSSVATQILLNRANDGGHCLFFSLEMSKHMVGLRMIAQMSGLPMSRIKAGRLIGGSVENFHATCFQFQKMQIRVDDTGAITVPQIRAKCRRMKAETGKLDLVVVDYLQLCGGTTRDGRERDVAEASAGLKAIAKEFSIPVIILSQLNRSCEARDDKRPRLADLRESGAIEQDADAVIMVYRHAAYYQEANPGEIELIIRKNRNGPLGTATVEWCPESMGVRDFRGGPIT